MTICVPLILHVVNLELFFMNFSADAASVILLIALIVRLHVP